MTVEQSGGVYVLPAAGQTKLTRDVRRMKKAAIVIGCVILGSGIALAAVDGYLNRVGPKGYRSRFRSAGSP